MSDLSVNKLIIITAPSGSGKSSIVAHLLKAIPTLKFSVSACTRSPRPNEVDGVHYHFIKPGDFEAKIQRNEFAEYEMVYPGKYYGTLKSELENAWANQHTPIVDIDVQGALRLMNHYGSQALSIFISAPSIDELRKRLEKRGTETPASLEERVQKANEEIQFANRFHVRIVNDELAKACEETTQCILDFIAS